MCASSVITQNSSLDNSDHTSHCFSAHINVITNTSCYYVDRCQLDCVSEPGRGWRTSSVTQRPGHLEDTNGPFCSFKMRALLTNKGQYFPLSAHRSPGER